MPWKVPIHSAEPGRPSSDSTRPRISPAALFVNVTARMPCGDALFRLDDPRDPMGEHAGLAAARAGEHQNRPHRGGDRLTLRVVEGVQNRGQVHEGAHCNRQRTPRACLFGMSAGPRTCV